jgi:hypothetical protein
MRQLSGRQLFLQPTGSTRAITPPTVGATAHDVRAIDDQDMHSDSLGESQLAMRRRHGWTRGTGLGPPPPQLSVPTGYSVSNLGTPRNCAHSRRHTRLHSQPNVLPDSGFNGVAHQQHRWVRLLRPAWGNLSGRCDACARKRPLPGDPNSRCDACARDCVQKVVLAYEIGLFDADARPASNQQCLSVSILSTLGERTHGSLSCFNDPVTT